jgi:hypothetical protein
VVLERLECRLEKRMEALQWVKLNQVDADASGWP